MAMIKGLIFDLDGVLVDTAKYHYLAWKRLADELHIAFNEQDNERLKGVSRMRSLDIILEIGQVSLDESQKFTLADRKNEWYKEYVEQMDASEVLEGVLEFLRYARALNLKIALGSASKNAPLILDRTGLGAYFDAVIDGNHVEKAKPNPEVFLLGAEALGLSPGECLVFEDAQAGIEAATAGNMRSVAVGDESHLKGAELYIKNMKTDFEKIKEYLSEVMTCTSE